jgi:PAS domain-containing protein
MSDLAGSRNHCRWCRRRNPFLVAEKFRASKCPFTPTWKTFQRRHQQTTIDAKAQQQVLFNSMLEGLLLLDRNRKIYLANRAFKNLFGLKIELRGKTVMEALRVHELAELGRARRSRRTGS